MPAGVAYRQRLSRSTDGVTLADGTANVNSTIAAWLVPSGVAYVIESPFILVMKLKDSTPAEIADSSLFWFGIKRPGYTHRVWQIAGERDYQPWADLTVPEQQDADHASFLWVDLGIRFLALIEDETFVLQVNSSSTVKADNVEIYIPYTPTDPEDVADLHAARIARFGG